MKTTLRFMLSAGLLTTLLVFNACKKEEDKKDDSGTNDIVSAIEANNELTSTSSTASSDTKEIINSEGTQSLVHMGELAQKDNSALGLKQVTHSITSNVVDLIEKYQKNEKVSNLRTYGEDGKFEISKHAGTYSWMISEERWDTSGKGQPADKVILKFPSDSTKTTNNATLTLNAFEQATITKDGVNDYPPTKIDVNLKLNNVIVAELIATASYQSDGIPITVSINPLYVKPFKFTASLNNAGATISGTLNLTKEPSTTLVDIAATLNFKDDTKKDLKNASGHVEYKALRLQGSADIEGLMNDSLNKNEAARINKFILIDILKNGRKLGSVYFEKILETPPDTSTEGDSTMMVYVKFNDGSKEKAEKYFKPIATDIENELKRLDKK
ncbi:MAG: hypothetical protein A3H98_04525 [Bacteroidetes bacterium RIFCSPLOWO2_02_FULL_36_8]|nr:MAG: hypothetical protein A3H98_04525 [Bacteroidetes bacterium RIFCSPLOWO2_02_FULL_36_8]OFY69040.1 MAG: hypothetical protein A3G23_13245 [Bacteroidetes bacterium RIFCSPLOWO2_12_FULL_37_12]